MLDWIRRAFASAPPPSWFSSEPWKTHTVRANPFTAPVTVAFELPASFKPQADDSFARFEGDDWFQVRFGQEDAWKVPPPACATGEDTEALYERVLRGLRDQGRSRILDSELPVKGAARALLCQEADWPEMSALRKATKEVLEDRSPEEREKHAQGLAAELAQIERYHVEAFSSGRHLTISLAFTGQQAEAKRQIMERFLRSLAIQE